MRAPCDSPAEGSITSCRLAFQQLEAAPGCPRRSLSALAAFLVMAALFTGFLPAQQTQYSNGAEFALQSTLEAVRDDSRNPAPAPVAEESVAASDAAHSGLANDDSAGEQAEADQKTQPNAPTQQPTQDDQTPQQTKRILGIIPNFRAVSADTTLPPQSVKEKFITATQDSFDYSSFFIPAALAAYSMGTDATPEFGDGADAYGRYLWHAALDQTIENYMVEFVVPVVAHQDTRYYTLGHGGFFKRTGYALSRVVITRSDSAKEVFNISEVVGAGVAAGLSSSYYPSRERSFSNTGTEWGINVGIDAISFVAKEFWPDINRYLFHGN